MLNAVSKLFPLLSEPQSSSNHCGTMYCAPTCALRRRCLCYLRAMSSVKRAALDSPISRDGGGGGSTRRARRRRKRRRKEGRKEGHRKTDGKGPRTPVKEEERRAAHATKLDQHKKEWGFFFGLAVRIKRLMAPNGYRLHPPYV